MKKKIWLPVAILLVCILAFFSPLSNYAFTLFQQKIAAVGEVNYTDEVSITTYREVGKTKVLVWVESNMNTQIDHTYTVYLYYDDEKDAAAGPVPVTWNVAQIPGTEQRIVFSGLDLSLVSNVYPRVIP